MGPNVLYMWIKEEQTDSSILLTLTDTTFGAQYGAQCVVHMN